MRTFRCAVLAVVLMLSSTILRAADPPALPEMPKPEKEHDWLKSFIGEWKSDVEITAEPGKPPLKATGTESIRSLGGFWFLSEGVMTMGEFKMSHVFTIGYDPTKKKYVGTWIDSMTSYQWNYVGTVNKEGTKLSLDTEGPCPCLGGKQTKFKEVTEFKSKDHKVFTSSYLGDDGKWVLMVKMDWKRIK